MDRNTYRVDGKTFRFSPGVFDSFFEGGTRGVAAMRELRDEIKVSVSSIKDWRRGAHSPSDIEKVEDIARWARVDVSELLIEVRNEKLEKLSEKQLDVLCGLWNQAYDFLELCDQTNHFVWDATRPENIPPSLFHDVTRSDESYMKEYPGEMNTSTLFAQTLDAYYRALRRAFPYVGGTNVYDRLQSFASIINEVGYGEDDGDWIPDPDMLFDPQPDRYVAPMIIAERKGKKLLDEISEELIEMRMALNESAGE